MTTLDDRKAALESRRAALVTRLSSIDAELDSHEARDWEDSAIEHEDDEVLEGMGRTAQRELVRIDAALRRIAEGVYGICVRRGATIAPERLDAVPETPVCRACAG